MVTWRASQVVVLLTIKSPSISSTQGKRKDRITGQVTPSNYGFWFDEDRQYDGYEFDNRDYLWGYDRSYPRLFFGKEQQTLVVVEGYKGRSLVHPVWLAEHGSSHGLDVDVQAEAALVAGSLEQDRLLLGQQRCGRDGTNRIAADLHRMMNGVLIARYPSDAHEGCQPDDLVEEATSLAITSADSYPTWRAQRRAKNVSW
jgi:hypothetical protein